MTNISVLHTILPILEATVQVIESTHASSAVPGACGHGLQELCCTAAQVACSCTVPTRFGWFLQMRSTADNRSWRELGAGCKEVTES